MKDYFDLDDDTLEKLILEVDRAAQNQENKLDRAEVETILKELNLPPELLDEAMEQVRRREALKKQRKRNIKIGMVITVFPIFLLLKRRLKIFIVLQQEKRLFSLRIMR